MIGTLACASRLFKLFNMYSCEPFSAKNKSGKRFRNVYQGEVI